eukprot:scaffold18901_cov121-Isochrysis_galbana.AAC.3
MIQSLLLAVDPIPSAQKQAHFPSTRRRATSDEARKAQGGGKRNLHLVFRGRWTIARGPSHTPFEGVRNLANTYRRCGAGQLGPTIQLILPQDGSRRYGPDGGRRRESTSSQSSASRKRSSGVVVGVVCGIAARTASRQPERPAADAPPGVGRPKGRRPQQLWPAGCRGAARVRQLSEPSE